MCAYIYVCVYDIYDFNVSHRNTIIWIIPTLSSSTYMCQLMCYVYMQWGAAGPSGDGGGSTEHFPEDVVLQRQKSQPIQLISGHNNLYLVALLYRLDHYKHFLLNVCKYVSCYSDTWCFSILEQNIIRFSTGRHY